MQKIKILPLLAAAVMVFSLSPTAQAAERTKHRFTSASSAESSALTLDTPASEAEVSLAEENLVKLPSDHVSWEVTKGQKKSEEVRFGANGELESLEEYDGLNCISIQVEDDSDYDAQAKFTFRCPDELKDEPGVFGYCTRFFAGEQTGYTWEDLGDQSLDSNGAFSITINELDGPWIYTIRFIVYDQEGNIAKRSYRYDFQLEIKSLEYIDGDDIVCTPVSGHLESKIQKATTYCLTIRDSEYSNSYWNERTLYMTRNSANEPASATFTLQVPYSLRNQSDLYLIAYRFRPGQTTGEVEDFSCSPVNGKALTFTLNDTDGRWIYSFQFGTTRDPSPDSDEFFPSTYEYLVEFEVAPPLEPITWDNIHWDLNGAEHGHIYYDQVNGPYPASDETNWIEFPVKNAESSNILVTLSCPEALKGIDGLVLRHGTYKWGISDSYKEEDIPLNNLGTFQFVVNKPSNEGHDVVHEIQFAVKRTENGTTFYSNRTDLYAFDCFTYEASLADFQPLLVQDFRRNETDHKATFYVSGKYDRPCKLVAIIYSIVDEQPTKVYDIAVQDILHGSGLKEYTVPLNYPQSQWYVNAYIIDAETCVPVTWNWR